MDSADEVTGAGARRQTVVVKVGGSTLPHREAVLADLGTLAEAGLATVVVHGGGAALTEWLKRLGKESEFCDGERITDAETLEAAIMVFAGTVNKQLVALMSAAGLSAVGLCGVDGGLVQAQRQIEPDVGLVGQTTEVRVGLLQLLLDGGMIPVLAPLVLGAQGQILNINADTLAGDVARALGASQIVFLTDVPGVRGADGAIISTLSAEDASRLRQDGTISGGMIPKVEACLRCLDRVPQAAILDGSVLHGLRAHVLDGATAGTMFRRE